MLLQHLNHVLRQLPGFKRRVAARRSRPMPTVDGDDERPLGCGWFDSSHELQCGLVVREADDAALGALPVGDWLDLHLSLCPFPLATPCDPTGVALPGAGIMRS